MATKRIRKKKLSKREYDKLKVTAYELVVVQNQEQKEVARILNLTEATLSSWAQEGKWKELREARMQCQTTETDNLRKLISIISKQRIDIEQRISDAIHNGDIKEEAILRKQASALSDEMSKHNKVLQTLENKNYSLGVFIDIMDEIFDTLRVQDKDLWTKTANFQSELIRKKINILG